MSLEFCSLASGSSGNCYLVKSEKTAILVDAGISRKRIFERLGSIGVVPDMLDAIVITHEHTDHIKGLRVTSKNCPRAKVYCSSGTLSALAGAVEKDRCEYFRSGDEFEIGDIGVRTFRTSHDAADPVGFSFYEGGRQVSIVTDTGVVTDEIVREIIGADMLGVEANHDREQLMYGPYPYPLKMRIRGEFGHLSNDDAAELIIRLEEADPKRRNVLLSHLSGHNNSPKQAMITVRAVLEDAGLHDGGDIRIDVASREEMGPLFAV